MPTSTPSPSAVDGRPRPRTLLVAWVLIALGGSLAVWLADVAFYNRFDVLSSDLPSWDPWSAMDLTVQLLAWTGVAALFLWWRNRHVVAVGIVGVLVLAAAAAAGWARHEADRARAGTPVRPAVILPFTFSAAAVRLAPYGSDQLPEGIPSRVLLLRLHPESVVVYDPVSREVMWVGDQVAVPIWTLEER